MLGEDCEKDRKALDEFGKDGWELVSVVHCESIGKTKILAYFKREARK
jgi:G:T-mismatch repair DNA endonuclease (very short patch repair protein)